MGVVERFSTAGRERGRAVLRGGRCVVWSDAIASKLAPTGCAIFTDTVNRGFHGVHDIANDA
jgi:hypothetical protein